MKKTLLICILFILTLAAGVQADVITIVADPWMPYNGQEGGTEKGFMIDIAVEVFGAAGHTVDYKNLNWDTAVEETRQGKFNAVVGASKDDAEGFVFPENNQGQSNSHFFVMKGNPWRFNGIASLKDKKIGVMEAYSYGEQLDAFLKDNPNAHAEHELIKLLELLAEGKIDVIIENYYVFMLQCMKAYMVDEIVDAGSDGAPEDVYVAFSPANPKSAEYAKILSDGTEKLRQSGQLKQIMERYGLKDWK